MKKQKNEKKIQKKIRFFDHFEPPVKQISPFSFTLHISISVYTTYKNLKSNYFFPRSCSKTCPKMLDFPLSFTMYRYFQLNHQNRRKIKNRFKTLFCYVWTHVNTFPLLVVPKFGLILSCSRKSGLRSKSPPTFQVTPVHGSE